MDLNNSQNNLVQGKEREIFIEAYDKYADQIYRFVYFKVGIVEEAQDLTSAVFLKTWNHIQKSGKADPKTLKALVYKIARNAVIDYYRERNVSKNNVPIEDVINNADILDHKQDIAKLLELKDDVILISRRLMELKDEYREIIILRFMDDFSIGEIAGILDKTRGNVRVLVFRALNALREIVNSKQ
jgi:RNA polymerase sigma-70 factor (ECF subfamily)